MGEEKTAQACEDAAAVPPSFDGLVTDGCIDGHGDLR